MEESKSKPISTFRDLMIWQSGKELAVSIYQLTKTFPQDERFGLTDQMRRSAVSIPSNIAEGFNRKYSTDYKRFLLMALGSCGELDTQLEIALALQIADAEKVKGIAEKIGHESRMVRKLLEKIQSAITERKAAFKKPGPEEQVTSPLKY